jgi:hypothetical protein
VPTPILFRGVSWHDGSERQGGDYGPIAVGETENGLTFQE